MLRIDDLKKRRNEWLSDGDYSVAMIDAHDCVHRVSPAYMPDGPSRWLVAWVFLDNSIGLPHAASQTWATKEEAMRWVDAAFAEHFGWFDAA